MFKKPFFFFLFFSFNCFSQNDISKEIIQILQKDILKQANWALKQNPETVTDSKCERSAGGIHDFYSEGDYWWQNPNDPTGPYIQKDGQTNPNNFVAHRKAMIRFSQIIGSLASAYKITQNKAFIEHAMRHLEAWFINEKTMMNPNLLYAQAISGKVTGRGIGIIDTIHLLEVAQGVIALGKSPNFNQQKLQLIKQWFEKYLVWLTTHQYGLDEKNAVNNHGTCWVMQVGIFAKLTDNQPLINLCIERFKTVLLPNQLAENGSFPLELKRTKPFGYSLFNLDAMATICQSLSTPTENLWNYELKDGRNLKKAVEFIFPFVENKEKWTYSKDVMYWNEWPIAQPFLIFAYANDKNKIWLNTWKKLNHYPDNEEVIRNLPIRNPLIWFEN